MKPAFSPPRKADTPPRACPSCAATMERSSLERVTGGALELDLCFDCHAIWFDQYESAQLSPDAVVALFRMIHEHRDRNTRPLADRMRCVHCRANLALTNDVQRTNRITYYRCAEGHGRLTTFLQFLREKNFVRTLSRPEMEQLKATVKQVRCSACGATVDIAKEAACAHCRSPVSVLDAEAVNRTLAELDAKARLRVAPDPRRIAEAMAPDKLVKREHPAMRKIPSTLHSSPAIFDLLVEGIEVLFD